MGDGETIGDGATVGVGVAVSVGVAVGVERGGTLEDGATEPALEAGGAAQAATRLATAKRAASRSWTGRPPPLSTTLQFTRGGQVYGRSVPKKTCQASSDLAIRLKSM